MGKRIIFPEAGAVEIEDFDVGEPAPGEVCVRTIYSLISIGTETTILHCKYDADTHFAKRFGFPIRQTGNQAIGVVEKIGANVQNLSPGQQVFIRKAHASHWMLAEADCSPVPASIPELQAVWCGMAKIAFRAAVAGAFGLGGAVLIIGAGPLGQMTARWALASGVARIVLADVCADRLALAPDGVETVHGRAADLHQQLDTISDGDGFPVIVDSTGNPAVFDRALALISRLGVLVLLGDAGYPAQQKLTSDLMTKGASIVAAHDKVDRNGWTERKIDDLYFQSLRRGAFDVDGLVTHQFKPDACEQAYALVSDNRGAALGVIFDWRGDC